MLKLRNVYQAQIHANYADYLTMQEKQRLALIDERIERKKLILDEVYEERRKITRRAIARMRRAQGKQK